LRGEQGDRPIEQAPGEAGLARGDLRNSRRQRRLTCLRSCAGISAGA